MQLSEGAFSVCPHCNRTIPNSTFVRHVDTCPERADLQEAIKVALDAGDGIAKSAAAYNATRGGLPSANTLQSHYGAWDAVALCYGLRKVNGDEYRQEVIAKEGLRSRLEIARRFGVSPETARVDLIAVYGKVHRQSKNTKGKRYGERKKIGMYTVNFRVPIADRDRLQSLADEQNVTVSDIARQAIQMWLEQQTNGTGAH